VDLSGTDVVQYSSVADMAGGFSFRTGDDAVVAFIGDVFSNLDGLSRRDRIRYDSPKWGGFYASGSYMNGQTWDLAGRFAREWDAFGRLAAAIGYTGAETQRDPYKQLNGSISWSHGSGFNLTLSAGNKDFDASGRNDATNFYGKVGYTRGKWAFSADYGVTEDLAQDGDEADTFGLAAVWNIWESVQFYGGYRYHSLDRDNVSDIEDVNAVMIGGRVRF
jgi:predicted porin